MRGRKHSRIFTLLLLLVATAVGFTLYSGWQSITVIADTNAPVFVEGTTCGYVSWRPEGFSFMGQTGLPVIAYIRENVGLEEVKARLCVEEWGGLTLRALQEVTLEPVTAESFKGIVIKTPWGIPIILPGSPYDIPTLTKLVAGQTGSPVPSSEELKDWMLYVYGGVFTYQVEANKRYFVVYTATDVAGNRRELKRELIPTYITGYVAINGKRVGVSDVITVQTLRLDIRFYSENEAMVYKVYGRMNGKEFEMKHQAPVLQQSYWQYIVELPSDGKYVFEIRVVDKANVDVQFASFTVDATQLGINSQTAIYMFAVIAGLTVAALIYLRSRRKRGRGSR